MRNNYHDIKRKLEQSRFKLCSDFVSYKPEPRQKVQCKVCGYKFIADLRTNFNCPNCIESPIHSLMEDDVCHVLESKGLRIIRNYHMRVQGKSYYLELDLFLPDLNAAFECNSFAYHNETKVYPDYHHYKTVECLKQGILLYHLWNNQSLQFIESLIDGILGISKFLPQGLDQVKPGELFRVSRDICPSQTSQWLPSEFEFLYEELPRYQYWVSSDYKGQDVGHKVQYNNLLYPAAFNNKDMTAYGIYKVYDSGTLVYRRVR